MRDDRDFAVAERDGDEPARAALERAVDRVPHPTLGESLQAVANQLPLALHVDFVNLRLVGEDRLLHLVAASGCSVSEIRKRAFQPLPLDRVREMLVSGGHDAVARSLGIQAIHVAWLTLEGEDIGTIAIGARTIRRLDEAGVRFLADVADRLARRLASVDRSQAALRECSLGLARAWTPTEWPPENAVAELRPRERAILELYADGLSTAEIADLLVIAPHTVRTHVKLALRRLGLHAREEAATMVRGEQLAELL